MIMLKDSVADDILKFFDECEGKKVFPSPNESHVHNTPLPPPPAHGDIQVTVEQPLQQGTLHEGRNTVTYEARLLKALFLRLHV